MAAIFAPKQILIDSVSRMSGTPSYDAFINLPATLQGVRGLAVGQASVQNTFPTIVAGFNDRLYLKVSIGNGAGQMVTFSATAVVAAGLYNSVTFPGYVLVALEALYETAFRPLLPGLAPELGVPFQWGVTINDSGFVQISLTSLDPTTYPAYSFTIIDGREYAVTHGLSDAPGNTALSAAWRLGIASTTVSRTTSAEPNPTVYGSRPVEYCPPYCKILLGMVADGLEATTGRLSALCTVALGPLGSTSTFVPGSPVELKSNTDQFNQLKIQLVDEWGMLMPTTGNWNLLLYMAYGPPAGVH